MSGCSVGLGFGRGAQEGRESSSVAAMRSTSSSSTSPSTVSMASLAMCGAGLVPVASYSPLNPAVGFTSSTYQPSYPSTRSTPA